MKRDQDDRKGASASSGTGKKRYDPQKAALFAGILAAASLFPGGPMHALPSAVLVPLWIVLAVSLVGWIRGVRARRGLEVLAGTVLFGGFFLLKTIGIRPSRTDENIYFYMVDRMIHGAVPYRDFFFAHPIGHLLFPVPAFVFGFHLWLAKLVPVIAAVVASGAVYTVWRSRRDYVAAAASAFLVLFSYQVLMASTNMNGENLATALLGGSLLLLVKRKAGWAGVAAGAALSCGLYNLAGVLTLALASWWLLGKNGFRRYALGWLAGFGLLFSVGWLLAGGAYWEQVVTYHLRKPPRGGHQSLFDASGPLAFLSVYYHDVVLFLGGKRFKTLLYYHAPQFLLLGGALVMILGRVGRWLAFRARGSRSVYRAIGDSLDTRSRLALVGATGVVLYGLEFAALNEVYSFYFVPLLWMLSLPGGYLVSELLRARTCSDWRGLWPVGVLLALLWLHLPLDRSVASSLWPREQRNAGQVVHYEWHEPIAFVGASHLARAIFFVPTRVRGAVTPYHRHYIWNKSLGFSRLHEVVRTLTGKLEPSDTITGASGVAPLVALMADVRMASDEADTNAKRFRTGQISNEQFLSEIRRDHVRFVIAAPGGYFNRTLMTRFPAYRNRFRLVETVVDRTVYHHGRPFPIDVYESREGR